MESSSMTSPVTAQEFVTAWQQSNSRAEVMKKTGMKLNAVMARAVRYRNRGVSLKRYHGGGTPVDYRDLSRVAHRARKS